MTRTALLFASALTLAACGGGAPQTPESLIVGEWDLVGPVDMSQGGQTVSIREGEIEFGADGSVESEVTMAMGGYVMEIESTGTYTMDGMTMTQTTTSASAEVIEGDDTARQIAAMIGQTASSQPPQTATLTSLTKDELVVSDPASGTTMTYRRD